MDNYITQTCSFFSCKPFSTFFLSVIFLTVLITETTYTYLKNEYVNE